MAEPSKRSWPWKKKLQDKISSVPESLESSPRASSHNSKFFDEQDLSKILSDHARVSDDAMMQWQQSDSKLKQLSDKLHSAQTELATKDILVKQHAKVAEEAVTGWEKADAEAVALKQQLDEIIHQKLATEDRVSHLDGALKECMRQLRHVREGQEQKIHETIVKKTHEYDKLRQEMEEKLAEAGLGLEDSRSEVLNWREEARATSILLEESRKRFGQLNESKSRSDVEFRVLQGRLESLEKECSTFKYELQIARKELEIRNEERDYERKVAENAGKNQVENSKKIAKLEAECHRLRLLMRKKLPGPAALAQMKIEVDSLDSTNVGFDSKRKSLGVRQIVGSSPGESMRQLDLPKESSDSLPERNEQAGVLAERLVGMDDELKMLKEALVRREQELQVSRLMCAKTASKLSDVEEQLEITLKRCNRNSIGMQAFPQQEELRVGGESVDSWDAASALLAELDQFKKATNRGTNVGELDLMNDFAEMERLAMVTGEAESNQEKDNKKEFREILSNTDLALTEKLVAKDGELVAANHLCKEVSEQLSQAEEKVSALQSRNNANEAVLVSLQAKLDRVCDKQWEDDGAKDSNITKELEDLVEAQTIASRAGAANEAILYDFEEGSQNGMDVRDGDQRYLSLKSISEMKYKENGEQTSGFSDLEYKSISLDSNLLLTAVRRVVQVVATLVQASWSKSDFASTFESGFENGLLPKIEVYSVMRWQLPDLHSGMQYLFGVSNKLLEGKADMVEFLTELAGVLEFLLFSHFRNVDQFMDRVKSPTDGPSGQENKELLQRAGLEKIYLEFQMRSLKDHKPKMEQVGEGFASPSKSSKIKDKKTREGANLQLGGPNGHLEGGGQNWSISKFELDKDMFSLYQKVASLEGELQGERQRHQEVTLKYLDLQQQFHSQSAGSSSSAGSITRDCSESDWGGSQNQCQSPDRDLRSMQGRKDVQIQLTTEKLVECQRSILDLGKQLEVLSSPSSCDSLNDFVESNIGCSVGRLNPYSDRNMQAHDIFSGNNTPSHEEADSHYAQLLMDRTCQSIAEKDYFACRNWGSTFCPEVSLSHDTGSRPISGISQANRTHSGNENDKQCEVGNDVREVNIQ